jgi:hypothetical protein
VTAPARRQPLMPAGVWLLGTAAALIAWILAAPLLLPAVVVLGGVVALGSLCVRLAHLVLAREPDSVPADGRPPALVPAGGRALPWVAWRCARPRCGVQGWVTAAALVGVDAELHTAVDHPGCTAVWQIVGATMQPQVGAA